MTECRFKKALDAAQEAQRQKERGLYPRHIVGLDSATDEHYRQLEALDLKVVIEALRAQQAPTLPPDAVERVREALEHYAEIISPLQRYKAYEALSLLPEVKKGGAG